MTGVQTCALPISFSLPYHWDAAQRTSPGSVLGPTLPPSALLSSGPPARLLPPADEKTLALRSFAAKIKISEMPSSSKSSSEVFYHSVTKHVWLLLLGS